MVNLKKSVKRICAVTLAALMLGGSAVTVLPEVAESGIVASAANSERDFYTEENYDGTINVTGYKGKSSNVVIPSKIFGEKVTGVNMSSDEFITSVTVPNTVKDMNFSGCEKLKKVTLQSGIQGISWGAFEYCTQLTSIIIPNSVGWIGPYAFSDCLKLSNINIPDCVTEIGNYAFNRCYSLTTMTIPNKVTAIRPVVFGGCTGLKEIKIPNSVTTIEESAFSGCTGLKEIKIPNSVTTIENSAFSGCTGLKCINLPNGVSFGTSYFYESGVFQGCTELTSIIIPNSVTKIGYNMFMGCKGLKSAVIPESVEEISGDAFEGCSNVTIYGKKNSAADKFANNHDIPFKAIVSTTGVTLNTSGIALNKGETYNLKATVHPTNATVKDVTWTTSNSNVATVNNGKVTAKNSGTAKITVRTYEGKTAACSVTVYGDATSVRLNRSSVKLEKGKSTSLSATVLPAYAKDKTVTWTSSNTKVATVSNGKVTAKSAGTATITAKTKNGKKATCKVTVVINPTSVKLNRTSVSLVKGKNVTLKATVNPSNASNKKVTWTSSNKKVATVSNGKVTAKNYGTAVITAKTSNGKKATCKVTVKNPKTVNPTSVKLSKTSVTLGKGKTTTLKAKVNPGSATNKKVTWTTSNKKVATVSNGKITAKGVGTATITVKTANGKKATCKVTVKSSKTVNPTKVKLSRTTVTLGKGKSTTLKATVSPGNATNKKVTWTTSNRKVATVSNGKITAKSVGTAAITVKTANGKKATCKVTVKNLPTKVKLRKTSATLKKGKTLTLKAVVTPSKNVISTVTWATSNSKVAVVKNGKVTAKAKGTAYITVKTSNGKTAKCKITVNETLNYYDTTPFRQKYWVIFTEGYRNNRVEASTIDSNIPAEQLTIIWDSALEISHSSESDGCDQYYLDDNGEWIYMRNYHRLTDKATNVLASNLDVVDRNGNVVVSRSPYSMVDWNEIDRYR